MSQVDYSSFRTTLETKPKWRFGSTTAPADVYVLLIPQILSLAINIFAIYYYCHYYYYNIVRQNKQVGICDRIVNENF